MFLLGTSQAKCSSPCNVSDMFLPVSRYPCPQCYPLLAEVSGRAQSKTVRHDRFKDLYLRDFVHAGKMVWRDRFRNVELTHFQEEMMARGLAIEHLEVDPVPEVADTCLGFTVVAIAEVFELEKRDEEVRASQLVVLDQS